MRKVFEFFCGEKRKDETTPLISEKISSAATVGSLTSDGNLESGSERSGHTERSEHSEYYTVNLQNTPHSNIDGNTENLSALQLVLSTIKAFSKNNQALILTIMLEDLILPPTVFGILNQKDPDAAKAILDFIQDNVFFGFTYTLALLATVNITIVIPILILLQKIFSYLLQIPVEFAVAHNIRDADDPKHARIALGVPKLYVPYVKLTMTEIIVAIAALWTLQTARGAIICATKSEDALGYDALGNPYLAFFGQIMLVLLMKLTSQGLNLLSKKLGQAATEKHTGLESQDGETGGRDDDNVDVDVTSYRMNY